MHSTATQPQDNHARLGVVPQRSETGPSVVAELHPPPKSFDVFQKLSSLPHVVFLDSAVTPPNRACYSFVAADPFLLLQSRRGDIRISGFYNERRLGDPFQALSGWLARFSHETNPDLPPFQGGAAGLFGYDLCHHIEKLPRPAQDEFEVPDMHVGLYDVVVAFDHTCNRAWLISTGYPETEPRVRRRRAETRAARFRRQLQRGDEDVSRDPGPRLSLPTCQSLVPGFPSLTSNFTPSHYFDVLERILEYIRAGDCFQVNLAQRLLYPFVSSPHGLYKRLRERNPAPFAGYYDLGGFVIASASPERFIHLQHGNVETRPIKGTRPRGKTAEEDAARIHELQTSAKDRSENIMIVDLLRNDLGRVCRFGSVRVSGVCNVETYPYVHHLVSQVEGQLRDGLGPIDLLRAAFPGGSVTGAPKIRAMEIIAELEPTVRGPYCGSLGYIGFDGNMDTNILIRTATIGGGWMQFPVGGGIVADSIPEREYEETWHKAQGILKAIE
jgi:para-aminobenzoate synthetase component 1